MTFESLLKLVGEPIFAVPPYAPLWSIALLKLPGGESVSGKGKDEAAARLSCLGEAAEVLSARLRDDDDRLIAKSITTGTTWSVDAKTVMVSDSGQLGSEGCAAGSDISSAIANALMERIERHGVSRWWLAQTPAYSVPKSWLKENGIEDEIVALRENAQTKRKTHFLLLEELAGVAVVMAISMDAADQLPVLGVAAASNSVNAARSALTELIQMEFALVLAIGAAKQEEISNEHRALFRRCQQLETHKVGLLTSLSERTPRSGVELSILDIATALPGAVWWAELTRDQIGIPVVRVVTEGLQGARNLKFTKNGGPV
ncbi:MAG: YcaO-like family protein [Litoreibacter sp.]